MGLSGRQAENLCGSIWWTWRVLICMGLSGRQAENLCGSIWWTWSVLSWEPVWVYLADKPRTCVGLPGRQAKNLCGSAWQTSQEPVWVCLADKPRTCVGLPGRQEGSCLPCSQWFHLWQSPPKTGLAERGCNTNTISYTAVGSIDRVGECWGGGGGCNTNTAVGSIGLGSEGGGGGCNKTDGNLF